MFTKTQLYQAIENNDAELVRSLIVDGASLEEPDEVHGPPLYSAIVDEKLDIVGLLLELGADPNGPDSGEWDSPLSEAASRRDIEAVRLLLDAGADPNLIRNDDIPLMSAVCENDLRITKLLIDAGADVYLTNRHGVNAIGEIDGCSDVMAKLLRTAAAKPNGNASLMDVVRVGGNSKVSQLVAKASLNEQVEAAAEAIKMGHTDDLAALLEAGVDPNGRFGKDSIHLLHLAIFNDSKDCCRHLIDAGADLEKTSDIFLHKNMTALMLAVAEKSGPLVKMMLAAGADVMAKNPAGDTPLSLARKSGRKQILKWIEAAVTQVSANFAIEDVNLHDAVRSGDIPTVEQLIDAGEEVNQADTTGRTPLMHAIQHSDAKMLTCLLNRGADPSLPWPKKHQCTWSEVVQQRAATKMAEALVDHVDDPADLCRAIYPGDQADCAVWMNLCRLEKKGVGDIARQLIRRGMDVNQRFSNGLTPLMVVASHANAKTVELVQILLEAGADPTAESKPNLAREAERKAVYEEMAARGGILGVTSKPKPHQPMTALDFAREGSRKVYRTLVELLGSENVATDRYDTADVTIKGFQEAAATPSFVELLAQVTERLGKPRAWRRREGVMQYRVKLKNLVDETTVEHDDELRRLEQSQELARQQGATLIYRELPADARHEVRALLVPTTDWAAIVRMCGTNGANYGLSTRDIVNRLAEIGERYPFEIQGCSHDFVAVRFSPLEDYESLDQTLLDFCPDLSDGTPDDRFETAEFYESDRRCFLWWD